MVPAFRGLGYGMLFTSFLGDVYYAMILGWCIFYTAVGFTSNLPWSVCGDDYNTYDCFSQAYQDECNANATLEEIYYDGTCVNTSYYCTEHGFEDGEGGINGTCYGADGDMDVFSVISDNSIVPAEDYFNGVVLGVYKNKTGAQYNMEDFDSLRWQGLQRIVG